MGCTWMRDRPESEEDVPEQRNRQQSQGKKVEHTSLVSPDQPRVTPKNRRRSSQCANVPQTTTQNRFRIISVPKNQAPQNSSPQNLPKNSSHPALQNQSPPPQNPSQNLSQVPIPPQNPQNLSQNPALPTNTSNLNLFAASLVSISALGQPIHSEHLSALSSHLEELNRSQSNHTKRASDLENPCQSKRPTQDRRSRVEVDFNSDDTKEMGCTEVSSQVDIKRLSLSSVKYPSLPPASPVALTVQSSYGFYPDLSKPPVTSNTQSLYPDLSSPSGTSSVQSSYPNLSNPSGTSYAQSSNPNLSNQYEQPQNYSSFNPSQASDQDPTFRQHCNPAPEVATVTNVQNQNPGSSAAPSDQVSNSSSVPLEPKSAMQSPKNPIYNNVRALFRHFDSLQVDNYHEMSPVLEELGIPSKLKVEDTKEALLDYQLSVSVFLPDQRPSVLILGLDGVGVEIAKNLILNGVRRVVLVDSEVVKHSDLSTNFSISSSDLDKPRAAACQPYLAKLNPDVIVETKGFNFELFPKFSRNDVVVCVNQSFEKKAEVNQLCRKNHLNFVSGDVFGVVATAFVDWGSEKERESSLESEWDLQQSSDDSTAVLHTLYLAVKDFRLTRGKLPDSNSDSETRLLMLGVREIAKNRRCRTIPDNKLYQLARCVEHLIPGVTAIAGGMIAHAVVKVTLGDLPSCQRMYFAAPEVLPTAVNWNDVKIQGASRHNPQVGVFGNSVRKRLACAKPLLVGVGAIGCEVLKNLALMGAGSEGSGAVNLVDLDRVEYPNIGKQLFYRDNNIGTSKVRAAKSRANEINNLTMTSHFKRCEDLDVESWADASFVIAAVDNYEARRFLDQQCVSLKKPLFEGGTDEAQGSTQSIIPFVTESYESSQNPDLEEKVPLCVIDNFPSNATHTLIWAHSLFSEAFNHDDSMEAPDNFGDCVNWANHMFMKLFNHEIKKLCKLFPFDHAPDGVKFWVHPKLFPTPLVRSHPLAHRFVTAAAALRAESYRLRPPRMPLGDVVCLISNQEECSSAPEPRKLPSPLKFQNKPWYVEFILSAAGCRAMNYGIKQASRREVLKYSGILPAAVTTTATVAGLICLEIYKWAQNRISVKDYRCSYVNLDIQTMLTYAPKPAQIIPSPVTTSGEFTLWDDIDIEGNLTLREILEHLRTVEQIEVEMLCCGNKRLFPPAAATDLDTTVSKMSCLQPLPRLPFLTLDIFGSKDGVECEIPRIRLLYT